MGTRLEILRAMMVKFVALVVLAACLVGSTRAALETDHWRTETDPEQGGFIFMWFSFALCIGFYTVLFLVFKHSLLTRYHFLLGMDLLCMLGMYVLHWGSYTEVTLGDYSAQIFFTFLELLFQLAVISDLIL